MIFAGLLAFTAVTLRGRYDDKAHEAQRRAENLTLILSDHLQRSIDSIDITLAQLASFGDRMGASASAETWNPQLRTAFNALSSVGSLSVLDKRGWIVHSTIPDIVGQSRADNFIFRELASTAEIGLVADAPFLSPRNGRILMPLGRRLTGPDGKFAGAVVATLEPERLRAFYGSINVGPNGVIWVFHPAGFIMFREPPGSDISMGRMINGNPLLRGAAKEKVGLLRAPLETGGESYLSAYRALSDPSLVVAISLSEKDIFGRWLEESKAPLWLLGFAGVVLLLAWFLIDREIRNRSMAETAFQKSQTRFQKIFDLAPMVVAVKDLDGRYSFVNRGFEQWTGRDSSALLRRTIREIFGDTKYTEDHEALDREVLATKKPVQREFARSLPLGPQMVLFAKFPLFDSGGEVEAIGSIALDITGSKKANDALLDSERLARGIIDTALDAFVQMDDKGHIIEWNAQAEKIFEWEREEAIGATLSTLIIPPSYRARHDAGFARFLQSGETTILGKRLEIPAIRRGGQELPVELTVTALRRRDGYVFNGFIRDLTEKKKTDATLERVFETSLDLILVVDPKGNLLRVSPSSTSLLGYQPEEVVGRNAIDFIHPDDLERTRNEMRMARSGHQTRNFETRYIHRDGRAVTLSWTGVWSEQAKQHFFIGRDMSERIKLEQELRQTQKMEAIGQLTGGIAHDYNNLLTVILGNAELLTEALRDRPELHALAQITLDAADRSATLTQRLLAFGRGQTLESRATDVNELLVGILELMRPTLGEHMKIEFHPGNDLWNPVVDRSQLETAVVNLAVNARDAMPTGGTLTIETANTVLDEDYVSLNPGTKQGDYVVIAVSDAGTGMKPEVLSRVFEPFFTTKEVGKGTGLGLSMIYGFVKQSGGHVAIYSEPGAGTVVRLYFPRADAPVIASIENAADEAAIPTGDEMILLVEDDPLVREHTERQLASFGYRVHTAAKASEATELIDGGLRPDLLLTDIVMPGGMNGRELADAARKWIPDLKVLFTSGYTQGALDTGEQMPGMNFLGKPFRRPELAAKIRELLDKRLLEDV